MPAIANSEEKETYAHGYDSALTQKMHARRTAAEQAAWFLPHLRPGMRLLDCGCATGSITVGLAEAVAPGDAIGIDISGAEIERARRRTADNRLDNLRFEVGDIFQLAHPDCYFDAVFCHNVLEHLERPDVALQRLHRVLRPGGVIGVRDTDLGGLLLAPDDGMVKRFFEVYEADWAGVRGNPRLGRHLRALLIGAGFVDVTAAASYESYASLEERRFISQVAEGRVTERDFVERVTERGLASTTELHEMRAAWLAWPDRPDAFVAIAHGEAVGRKAQTSAPL